jgi:hypothetical protein
MTRTLTMDPHGNFTVSDDPQGVIAVALLVATTPANRERFEVALDRDGDGLHVQGVGSIDRVTSREELPAQFDGDPVFDPETQELWRLYREPDHEHPHAAAWVVPGYELRALVMQAIALRAQR